MNIYDKIKYTNRETLHTVILFVYIECNCCADLQASEWLKHCHKKNWWRTTSGVGTGGGG